MAKWQVIREDGVVIREIGNLQPNCNLRLYGPYNAPGCCVGTIHSTNCMSDIFSKFFFSY